MWFLAPMVFSIYNAMIIPFQISFGTISTNALLISTIEYTIDVVFLVDLILTFFTSRQDKRGYEMKDHYSIFRDYTRTSRFLFDFLALLGMGFFTFISPYFKYFQLFKALRVFRINKMIQQSQTSVDVKAVCQLVKMCLYLFLYIHWIACIINAAFEHNSPKMFLIDFDLKYRSWFGDEVYKYENGTEAFDLPYDMLYGDPVTFGDDPSWKRMTSDDALGFKQYNSRWEGRSAMWNMPCEVNPPDQELFTKYYSKIKRYSRMLYYSIVVLGLGEVLPVNKIELFSFVMLMICSAMIFSLIFGEIATLIFSM